MKLLTEKYEDKIQGILSCYDRVIIQGTLPYFCYAQGMTSFLYANKIMIFNYPDFAKSLRDELRQNAETIAKDNGIEIEFIRKNNFRKEKQIKKITVTVNNRTYKGFNFFSEEDQIIFENLLRGEYITNGFQNKTLQERITQKNSAQISRLLKRLRVHGMIKKVNKSYKYYLTRTGLEVILMGLKLKELYIIPNLSTNCEGY